MFDKLEDLLIRYEEVMGELQEPGVANDPERFRELYNALLVDGGYNRPGSIFHPEGLPFLCRGTEACRSCIPR